VYIPTWRNWLRYSTEKEFLDSEYYNETLNIIQSLTELQHQYSFEFEVCIHHALDKFTHLYKSDKKISFVDMSTINVQDMIINTGMLISDYSSISFDFAFLEKPVIFYQFDREKFLKVRHGAFIDYKTELFGPVIEDLTALNHYVKTYIDNSYQMNDEDKYKAKRYFTYHDAKNSERIFNAINKKLKEKSL
jgi:CDP-glycerol glycerophosphotransferase